MSNEQLLSERAERILEDFRGRCRQSSAQGVFVCDTANVIEDDMAKVTPIEPAYVFDDAGQAGAVADYLKVAFQEDGFNNLSVQVEPLETGSGQHHIHISAAW